MNDSKTDQRVTAYIQSLPEWQQEVCKTVRQLLHMADGEITETIKRNKYPYFVLCGNVAALMATKTHINIFIYDPIAPDPLKIINQGQGNLTARSIQVYQNDPVNEPAMLELFKAVIADNRAGGWRKITKSAE